MGILERGGKVRATVVPNRRKKALQDEVKKYVEAGAALHTDALLRYQGLAAITHTKSSIMRSSTWTVKCIPTAWRTSGVC